MRPQQKEARFHLFVIVGAVSLTAIAALIISQFFKNLNPMGALGFLSLIGISGLSPLFYRRQKSDEEVLSDERDLEIGRKAILHSFGFFWLFFIAVCVLPGVLNHWQGSITFVQLALIGAVGWLVFFATRSTSILIQYREN